MKLFQRARVRVPAWCAGGLALCFCLLSFGQSTAPNSADQVLAHLNLVLRWAQQWERTDVFPTRIGDALYIENGRDLAQQVTKLEFQAALAQAALIGNTSKKLAASSNGSPTSGAAQSISKLEQRIDLQVQGIHSQLDTINQQIASARAKDKPPLISTRDTLQGQLQLAQALEENLQNLSSFMTSAERSAGSATELTGKILSLERTNPEGALAQSTAKTTTKSTPTTGHATPLSNSQNPGLIGELGQMVHFIQSMRALKQLQNNAEQLRAATVQLRAPLLAALRSTLKQGQIELSAASAAGDETTGSAGAQPGAATSNPTAGPTAVAKPDTAVGKVATETAAQKQQAMTELVAHFKLLSKATLPLSQELILIDQSQANLNQLQGSIQHDYYAMLRTLLFKVASILIALGLIWLFSELWRRAAFRYIKEPRRRRQFLVLRRVVTGFFMLLVIVLGFISDFSSLATYAGLITAGIAVALQAVILSIAAYFFLVGRYGVKVGDRVTVVYSGNNSVAGDVVDIGLVRFYMSELAGSGVDMQPTGRICVFPNSVLFQTNPLYKQFPGAEYAWREVGLPLAADSDAELAEKELLAAAERLFATYHKTLESERSSIEATMGMAMKPPQPYTRRRFVSTGLEIVVRYPIPLRQAGDLDDRMVLEVTDLLRKNPLIKLAAGAVPDLRSPVKI